MVPLAGRSTARPQTLHDGLGTNDGNKACSKSVHIPSIWLSTCLHIHIARTVPGPFQTRNAPLHALRRRLRLRPILLRLRTQSPHGLLLQPPRLPLHSPNRKIILPSLTLEHLRPILNRILDLLLRFPHLLLPILLLLRRHVLLIESRHVGRDVRPLCAAQIGRAVLGETASDEAARGVFACEDVVAAAWAVEAAACGDVVDCAIKGEVDGFGLVGAVVGEEVGIG